MNYYNPHLAPPPLDAVLAQTLDGRGFVERVLADAPRVAVFDCDGTLWSGDAGSGFMDWTVDRGLVEPAVVARMRARYAEYHRGRVPEAEICGEMIAMYAGLDEPRFADAARRYVEDFIRPRFFEELIELAARLRDTGCELWAVSSTNAWVIREAVPAFGIDPGRVLAASVAVEDGWLTDRLIDVPTGEGKARSLEDAGVRAPEAVFGNSIHDAAMLALARRAYAVNPSPGLAAIAARNGWTIYYPDAIRNEVKGGL